MRARHLVRLLGRMSRLSASSAAGVLGGPDVSRGLRPWRRAALRNRPPPAAISANRTRPWRLLRRWRYAAGDLLREGAARRERMAQLRADTALGKRPRSARETLCRAPCGSRDTNLARSQLAKIRLAAKPLESPSSAAATLARVVESFGPSSSPTRPRPRSLSRSRRCTQAELSHSGLSTERHARARASAVGRTPGCAHARLQAASTPQWLAGATGACEMDPGAEPERPAPTSIVQCSRLGTGPRSIVPAARSPPTDHDCKNALSIARGVGASEAMQSPTTATLAVTQDIATSPGVNPTERSTQTTRTTTAISLQHREPTTLPPRAHTAVPTRSIEAEHTCTRGLAPKRPPVRAVLPTELWGRVLSFVEYVSDLGSSAKVCRVWREELSSRRADPVWQRVWERAIHPQSQDGTTASESVSEKTIQVPWPGIRWRQLVALSRLLSTKAAEPVELTLPPKKHRRQHPSPSSAQENMKSSPGMRRGHGAKQKRGWLGRLLFFLPRRPADDVASRNETTVSETSTEAPSEVHADAHGQAISERPPSTVVDEADVHISQASGLGDVFEELGRCTSSHVYPTGTVLLGYEGGIALQRSLAPTVIHEAGEGCSHKDPCSTPASKSFGRHPPFHTLDIEHSRLMGGIVMFAQGTHVGDGVIAATTTGLLISISVDQSRPYATRLSPSDQRPSQGLNATSNRFVPRQRLIRTRILASHDTENGHVISLRYAEDGQHVLAGFSNGRVHVVDIRLRLQRHVLSMRETPDIVVASSKWIVATNFFAPISVACWDANDGRAVHRFDQTCVGWEEICTIAGVVPTKHSDRFLLWDGKSCARILDVSTGRFHRIMDVCDVLSLAPPSRTNMPNHNVPEFGATAAHTGQGKLLLCGDMRTAIAATANRVLIFDLEARSPNERARTTRQLTSAKRSTVALSSDHRLVVTAETDAFGSLAGRFAAVGRGRVDTNSPQVCIWKVETGELVRSFPARGRVLSLSVAGNAISVITAASNLAPQAESPMLRGDPSIIRYDIPNAM